MACFLLIIFASFVNAAYFMFSVFHFPFGTNIQCCCFCSTGPIQFEISRADGTLRSIYSIVCDCSCMRRYIHYRWNYTDKLTEEAEISRIRRSLSNFKWNWLEMNLWFVVTSVHYLGQLLYATSLLGQKWYTVYYLCVYLCVHSRGIF